MMASVRSVYEYRDYREYLQYWLSTQTRKRGNQAALAQAAGVSSTLMSLILKGDKHLTLEQASELCDLFSFNERETDFFLTIVALGRAGSVKLKNKLLTKIRELQKQSQKLSERLEKDVELSDEVKAIFYSSWLYTAIMNLVAVAGYDSAARMAEYLQVPQERVVQAIAFLRAHRLIAVTNGRYVYGPANTHIGVDSPFVTKHHQNWRLRGFNVMESRKDTDLFYSCPMSLSQEAADQIRQMLPTFIEQILKVVRPSPSEKVACLNIDWFGF